MFSFLDSVQYCLTCVASASFIVPGNLYNLNCLIMAGTGRQFFNESEKICLQELIVKYKLNSMATTLGNSAVKKISWARLTEEYNSIETNTKRTEAQLKKCWDNLKTRRKTVLAHEKRERMRTGGGSYNPKLPSTSSEGHLLDDALTDQTDVELAYVIDSDQPEIINEDMEADSRSIEVTETQDAISATRRDSLNETLTERGRLLHTPPRQTESHLTNYSAAPSQGSRNVRTRVIQEEFSIRQENYIRAQRRDEELHKLKMEEQVWMVKAAEENFLKVKAEREAAEEVLCCNRAKREEAELRLFMFKNKK